MLLAVCIELYRNSVQVGLPTAGYLFMGKYIKINKSNTYIACASETDFKPPSFYSYLISLTSPEQKGKITSNGVKEIGKLQTLEFR